MSKIQKGDFGYIRSQKKKRTVIALIMFAIPVIIFLTGLFITHTRKNMFTLVAIMGCLPASKFAVNMIMMWLQKPISEKQYEEIASHVKDMTVIYEATVSAYEKNTPFVCLVVSGLHVVGFTQSPKADPAFAEQHIKKILQGNGFKSNVKVFTDQKQFLRRVDELYPDHLEKEAAASLQKTAFYPFPL